MKERELEETQTKIHMFTTGKVKMMSEDDSSQAPIVPGSTATTDL